MTTSEKTFPMYGYSVSFLTMKGEHFGRVVGQDCGDDMLIVSTIRRGMYGVQNICITVDRKSITGISEDNGIYLNISAS